MSTKPKRRGRPAKRSDERKGSYLVVRLGPEEKTAFKEAAEIAGIPLSAWARERLRRTARLELEEVGRPSPFVPSVAKFVEGLRNG